MSVMSDKLELIRELVEMTDGSEVKSANEMDVQKVLSVPLGTVLYPRLSITQAKAFVEKCMDRAISEYIQANRNPPDYGEQ